MKNKYVLIVIVILAGALLVGFKLNSNKKQFQSDIAFSQRTVDKFPVMVDTVTSGVLTENVVASGTLVASQVLNLVSETQGKILTIQKHKGDMVNAGDIIVKVDDEVIAANVLTAEANYEQNLKDIERFKRLADENAITKRDLEQASIGLKKAKADLIMAQRTLNNTSIKAPISGYINSDNVTIGQFLSPGASVCEIVNNNVLKLNIGVSEKEVFKIQRGQDISISLSAFPNQKYSGRVISIAEKADEAMKFDIEIEIKNSKKDHLLSGMFAEAELPVKNTAAIIINKECIIGSMENPVVYIARDGKAMQRTLVLGQSNDKQVEVLKGLSENELVIINGQLNLKDGSEIKVIN